jgi:transcriptional regulator with PAS, ATPase and Fis domain
MFSNWVKEFPAAVTVCNKEGTILEMNDKSAFTFSGDGGYELIAKNLFKCHSPASIEKIKEIMKENRSNVYTIEKNGIKKLIYQAPWYDNGEMKGVVELSIEIPFEIPHFVRS